MRTVKRLLFPMFLLFLAGMVFAADDILVVTKPEFSSSDPETQVIIDNLRDQIDASFSEFMDPIKAKLDILPRDANSLARAFANATVFSSDGASQRAYEGFKAFSFTVGLMGALQVPRKITTFFYEVADTINSDDVDGEDKEFEVLRVLMNDGLGFDVQFLNAQLGINTSKFLLDGLYLGLKFSMVDTNWIKAIPLSGFSYKTMSFGVNASYQLIRQKRFPGGIFVWRGLNLGAGFTWQESNFELAKSNFLPKDWLRFQFTPEGIPEEITMQFKDTFHLGLNTTTYIIPIEVMTSLRLLWFLNMAVGAGVDIAFGGSTIDAHGSVDLASAPRLPDNVNMDREPRMTFALDGKSAPRTLNAKAMGAVGFNFGPVIVDVPVTYYFSDNGYSFGLTFGFTL